MASQPEEDPVYSFCPIREWPDQPWVYVPPGDRRSESYRLSTFSKMDYPASTYPVSKLAQEGFFYTGYRDRVKCCWCDHSMENWVEGDHVRHLEKHILSGCPAEQRRKKMNIYSKIIYRGSEPARDCSNLNNNGFKFGPKTPKSHKKLLSELDMTKEVDRRKTFKKWPSYPAPKLPTDLAKAGFFYLGNLDRVQCFSCGIVLRNWHPTDIVHQKHQRFLPHCGILTGEETRNVELESRSDLTTSPKAYEAPPEPSPAVKQHLAKFLPCCKPEVPSKSSLESRLQSFAKWPANRPQAEKMARAGFFYLRDGDSAQCFYCNGGLQKWNDEPWVEHAKWFPGCEFVLRQKGTDFVRSIFSKHPNLNRPAIRNPVAIDSIPPDANSPEPDVEAEGHIYVPPGDDGDACYRLGTIGDQAIVNPTEARKWANAGFMSCGKGMQLVCNKCGAVIPELGKNLNVGHLPDCPAAKRSDLGRDEKILEDFFRMVSEAIVDGDIPVHPPDLAGRTILLKPPDPIHPQDNAPGVDDVEADIDGEHHVCLQ